MPVADYATYGSMIRRMGRHRSGEAFVVAQLGHTPCWDRGIGKQSEETPQEACASTVNFNWRFRQVPEMQIVTRPDGPWRFPCA